MSETPEQEITRILTSWPEADRLAGVLRVVRAMQEECETLDLQESAARTLLTQALEAVDALHSRLALADKCIDAARECANEYLMEVIAAYDAAKGETGVRASSPDPPCRAAGSPPEPLLALADALVKP